jgi:hypothetical protein
LAVALPPLRVALVVRLLLLLPLLVLPLVVRLPPSTLKPYGRSKLK